MEVKNEYFFHIKDKLKISTINTYESKSKHLKFFEPLPINQINAVAIDQWLKNLKDPAYLKSQHSTRLSYQHELEVLSCILNYYGEYLADDGYFSPIKKRHYQDAIIDHVRYQQAKNKAKKKYMTGAQIEIFLGAIKLLCPSTVMRLFVYQLLAFILVRCGPRVGEACALNLSDVDSLTGETRIEKSVMWLSVITIIDGNCSLTLMGNKFG
jgi:integrase